MASYIIPATLVLMWVFSSSSSLAKPKSDIIALRNCDRATPSCSSRVRHGDRRPPQAELRREAVEALPVLAIRRGRFLDAEPPVAEPEPLERRRRGERPPFQQGLLCHEVAPPGPAPAPPRSGQQPLLSQCPFGVPMEVSVVLRVLISELSEEPWKGKLITFSADPELQKLEGDTLLAKTEFVRKMEWGMNTDFEKVFDRILEIATEGELSEDQMIKRVFVFSDVEFDVASQNPWETDYQAIQRKFGEKGYQSVSEIVIQEARLPAPYLVLRGYYQGLSSSAVQMYCALKEQYTSALDLLLNVFSCPNGLKHQVITIDTWIHVYFLNADMTLKHAHYCRHCGPKRGRWISA
ncbi:hypothetical protein RJ640_023905 [Escallonia rubra]|uniref:DUF7788 domain-containing protein n=1 Tax=Escallonia rubra TaxID=112253 RepID=A0AA88U2H2_9ASTE|nr:hypothetical protein RJ640_023905 [Escallonia rubra]